MNAKDLARGKFMIAYMRWKKYWEEYNANIYLYNYDANRNWRKAQYDFIRAVQESEVINLHGGDLESEVYRCLSEG